MDHGRNGNDRRQGTVEIHGKLGSVFGLMLSCSMVIAKGFMLLRFAILPLRFLPMSLSRESPLLECCFQNLQKRAGLYVKGTSDAVRALKATELVCNDVAAVDINMGYPKPFFVSGVMGAALLTKPEVIHDILTALKRNLSIPVMCKIRLLKSPNDTVELARRIEKIGVSVVAVHGSAKNINGPTLNGTR